MGKERLEDFDIHEGIMLNETKAWTGIQWTQKRNKRQGIVKAVMNLQFQSNADDFLNS